jgi:uncharacterized protein YhaN
MTLDELTAAKDRVEKAMLRGESVIEFEGRRTEFRSYDDMMAQLGWINDQIANLEGDGTGDTALRRVRVISSDKDLGY